MVEQNPIEKEPTFTYSPREAIELVNQTHPYHSLFHMRKWRFNEDSLNEVEALASAYMHNGNTPTEVVDTLSYGEANVKQLAWLVTSDHESIHGAKEKNIRFRLWELAGREIVGLTEKRMSSLLYINGFHMEGDIPWHIHEDQVALEKFREILLDGFENAYSPLYQPK